MDFFGYFMYIIISSANIHIFISSFIVSSCLNALRLQVLYRIYMEKMQNLVLFLIFVELHWVFLHLDWFWLCIWCELSLLCWGICLVYLILPWLYTYKWIRSHHEDTLHKCEMIANESIYNLTFKNKCRIKVKKTGLVKHQANESTILGES